MDKRLVEYCLSLPASQSYSGGWSRVVMRRAMEGIVPSEVQWRAGKTHSGAPYRYLLLEKSAEALEQLGARLDDVASSYLNVPYLTNLLKRKGDISDDDTRSLGNGMTIAFWLWKRTRSVRDVEAPPGRRSASPEKDAPTDSRSDQMKKSTTR